MPHLLNVSVPKSASPYMSVEQFKEWLKHIDTNGDGLISKKELEQALRKFGFHFCGWKARRAIAHVDRDHNRHINGDGEIFELINYAQEKWGIVIR